MRAGVLPAVTIDGEEDRYCSGTHSAVTSLSILNVTPSFVLKIRCQVVGGCSEHPEGTLCRGSEL